MISKYKLKLYIYASSSNVFTTLTNLGDHNTITDDYVKDSLQDTVKTSINVATGPKVLSFDCLRDKLSSAYLFLMGAVNNRASEVMNRSMGRPVSANAHAPKGQKFSLTLQSSKRPASRSSYKTTFWP
jgi:hypothetical protein